MNFALHTLKKIRKKFNPETCGQFTTILDVVTGMIPSSYAVVAISRLFQHHPDLLLSFEAFVPANFSPAAAVAATDEADSLDFLDRVSEIFSTDNNGVYREFLDSMASYSKGEYTVSKVREKVVGLFGENHPDLTAQFMSFLPELESETELESGSESSNDKSAADNDFGGKQIRVPGRRKRGRKGGDDDKVTGPSPKKVKSISCRYDEDETLLQLIS